jgi:hypothetical protein
MVWTDSFAAGRVFGVLEPGWRDGTADRRDDYSPRQPRVDDDILAAGREIQIESRVNGDVTAAGRGVVISGPVKQDIWAAGQDVVVNASVGDDLRAQGLA